MSKREIPFDHRVTFLLDGDALEIVVTVDAWTVESICKIPWQMIRDLLRENDAESD